jgi:hypothetical protein
MSMMSEKIVRSAFSLSLYAQDLLTEKSWMIFDNWKNARDLIVLIVGTQYDLTVIQ